MGLFFRCVDLSVKKADFALVSDFIDIIQDDDTQKA